MSLRTERFVALPLGIGGQWYLPSQPGRVARNALLLAAPFRPAAFAAWTVVRTVASVGGLRLLPKAAVPALPRAEAVAAHVPQDGHVALRPALKRGRWTVLTLTADGQPDRLVKVAFTDEGAAAIRHEVAAHQRVADRLPRSLQAPQLIAADSEMLAFEALAWQPRPRSWHLPTEVATGLGELTCAGISHGDFAPWNLLDTDRGWYVIDWEASSESAQPWVDTWHYIVYAHALLGRPSQHAIMAGLHGEGWVGEALRAYATAAGVGLETARPALRSFLDYSLTLREPNLRRTQAGRRRRIRLRAALLKAGAIPDGVQAASTRA